MKAGRTQARRIPPEGDEPLRKPESTPSLATLAHSRNRRWFRALALLSPFLFLGLAEFGLRLAGYGFPTSFFLERHHEGRTLLVENPKFGWRFFPPAVARSPLPISLDAVKPPGAIRIFVLGGSAAMGDPEPSYGVARQLEQMLRARDPNRRFEVVNAAMTAINSHVVREIASDCASRSGDFWLIYAGNNEVVGPFGVGTVFGRRTPGMAFVRTNVRIKATRFGQWLSARVAPSSGPAEWQGMEMFLSHQIREDAPSLRVVYDHFARNLEAVIEHGRRSGARVILTTVPVNLRDSPPFASQHQPDLEAKQLEAWNQRFAEGKRDEEAGRFAEALALYQQAAQIDPQFAELLFRRAECELALGQTNAAAADFGAARDLDTLRFRADSKINQTIRQVAAREGVACVDAEQECARHEADGIPGDALFFDHVHLNFAGNHLLAALFATAIEEQLADHAAPAGAPLLSEAELGRLLAFTEFDRHRVGEEVRARLRQPPFVSQLNEQARDRRWREKLALLETPPATCSRAYQDALALAPNDWVLHANYARLLEAAADEAAASNEWQTVSRMLPFEPDAWFHLGNLAYHSGLYPQAQQDFQEALLRKPDLVEAMNGLGLVLAAEGRVADAVREYKAVLQLRPSFSTARVNLALALATQGQVPAAITEYRTVLQLDTNNVAARINLAKLLAAQGGAQEAIALFQEALDLKPDEPVAHFNLANTLAAQGKHAEALPHYQAAVTSKPGFAEARFNLAVELARAGNLAEALPQFAEAVRLQPDSAEARYDYGIALAKMRRYAEAATEFQETLLRQPGNTAAKAALDRARELSAAPH